MPVDPKKSAEGTVARWGVVEGEEVGWAAAAFVAPTTSSETSAQATPNAATAAPTDQRFTRRAKRRGSSWRLAARAVPGRAVPVPVPARAVPVPGRAGRAAPEVGRRWWCVLMGRTLADESWSIIGAVDQPPVRTPAASRTPGRRAAPAPAVLVIEDQPALARLIERILAEEGFRVSVVHDGPAGRDAALASPPDAIILDVGLPGLDGLAVSRAIRARGLRMPILMLTARDAVPDRVAGLEAGADDYVVKPFAFEELLARLRVHLRRAGFAIGQVRVADLAIDPEAHTATRAGRPLELSPQEFSLLELLARHVGQVLTRDQILEHVWGYDAEPSSNVVDLYVHYLRRKVDHGFEPPLLHTVRGVGYVLRA